MLFASIWGSFLAQVSVLLLFQNAATLRIGEETDLFLKSEPIQNFQNFSGNLLGLNNLYEIL